MRGEGRKRRRAMRGEGRKRRRAMRGEGRKREEESHEGRGEEEGGGEP